MTIEDELDAGIDAAIAEYKIGYVYRLLEHLGSIKAPSQFNRGYSNASRDIAEYGALREWDIPAELQQRFKVDFEQRGIPIAQRGQHPKINA